MKQKLHLVGYLLIRYFKDARYHEHKIRSAVCLLGQEDCEDAERYGVAAARRIETVAGSVFIRYSLASCAFVFGQFI